MASTVASLIAIWDDVGDELERSKKVSSKDIVISLENARQYMPSYPQAQRFVKKHLANIVENVLEQEHDKIQKMAKIKVKEILRLALEIANEELTRAICNPSHSSRWATLPVLAKIFDKRKQYYTDPLTMTNGSSSSSGSGGYPEVRIDQIKLFHRMGGFTNLSSYATASPSNLGSYFITLHPLLEVTFEAMHVTKGKVNESADTISKAIMKYLVELGGEALARISTLDIQHVCINLRRINKKLAFSNNQCQTLSDFHTFWMNLVLNLIRLKSSTEHKIFGMKQIGAMIESTHLPKSFTVSGAGCEFINGKYELASSILENGYICARTDVSYERIVPENDPNVSARGKRLKLQPCIMMEAGDAFLSVWWFISDMDNNDYYFNKSKLEEEDVPQSSGWILCANGDGIEPPPSLLEPSSVSITIGDERNNTLEQQLCRWMVQNKVFDIVLKVQADMMETSKAMMRFLSRNQSGDGPNQAINNNLVLDHKTKLLEHICPMLSEDPSPPTQHASLSTSTHSTVASSSFSAQSSDYFKALGAAKQRLASAERWRQSAQNAMQQYLDASKEVLHARSYLEELECSREVINVDEVDSDDDESEASDKKPSKRHRRR